MNTSRHWIFIEYSYSLNNLNFSLNNIVSHSFCKKNHDFVYTHDVFSFYVSYNLKQCEWRKSYHWSIAEIPHSHTSSCEEGQLDIRLIKKLFASLDEVILPLLFTSIVRPHLEYGNIIWGPHFIGDMKAVERVQKRATKMIPNLHNLSYRERLEILNLSSLYHRRRRGDMIMCVKIITKRINIDANDFFTLST